MMSSSGSGGGGYGNSNGDYGELARIACCLCGISIEYNPSNMCMNCLRDNSDITGGLPSNLTIHKCRSCTRFLCPPWQEVALESKELMTACLRKIPGLNKLKLVDAVWIWTEPHSMRLKIKLTIQKEVVNGAILQQAAVVTFIIRNQQCKHCEQSYAQGAWHAVVQVRQRVSHKRTFFFLEQLLLKHHAHSDSINIVTFRDGMDFYFLQKQNAMRFIDFLSSHIPTKVKFSRKLISQDKKSGTAEFKNNFLIEIVPLCKDDLVILPKELARNLSNFSPLVLIKSISAGIHIVDPISGERQEINTEKYWRDEFGPIMNTRQLIRFVVLSVEPLLCQQRVSAKRRKTDKKMRMAECTVARERDFGVVDTQFVCVSHLGHVLRVGDVVLGYDLSNAQLAVDDSTVNGRDMPDVILVRKQYANKKDRIWTLKNLDVEGHQELTTKEKQALDDDYEEFMQEIEGDKEMRANIKLYKNQSKNGDSSSNTQTIAKVQSNGGDSDNDDAADEDEIQLDELLDDLEIGACEVNDTTAFIATADNNNHDDDDDDHDI